MPLYKVTLELEVYAWSNNEDRVNVPDEVERKWLTEMLSDADPGDFGIYAYKVKNIPTEWENAVPYGDRDDDMTCKEIIEDGKDV